MNESIKKMLWLIYKDLMITEVSYEIFHKEKTLIIIINSILSLAPRACRSCGSTVVDGNGKTIVVKNRKKEIIGLLKIILSDLDIQLRIISNIKLLLY